MGISITLLRSSAHLPVESQAFKLESADISMCVLAADGAMRVAQFAGLRFPISGARHQSQENQ